MAHLALNPNFFNLPISLGCSDIEDKLRNFPIRTMSDNDRHHILDKIGHKFSDDCGEECVKFVAEKVKANLKVDIAKKNKEGCNIQSSDKCKHGCEIIVRLGLSTKKEWKISTAFHKEICKGEKVLVVL